MTDFAELEISLDKAGGGQYAVELCFTQPNSDADTRVGADAPITVQFDLPGLQAQIVDAFEYGRMLSESLFSTESMRSGFLQARASAQTAGVPLHVRLSIGPSADELNSLYWETLIDPQDKKTQLFTTENMLFSRYLASSDWRPVQMRARGSLKALLAASNPTDLEKYKLAALDVPAELARARQALGDISMQELGSAGPCTLNALIDQLRDGVDILYLAAHGTAAAGGEPRIWLQAEDGKAAITSAEEIVTRIRELPQQPRLIVLASCQSAGKGAGAVLQSFGPRLAQAGAPAVIAMQGNISMDSVSKLMPVFFRELYRDGQIDRALAVARGAVRGAPDFWMPVLFMRLKSGKIWYLPGVGEGGKEFDKWPTILSSVQAEQCTPILGPGLYEHITGSFEQIADSLSDQFNFPLAAFLRDSMPVVTQYIAINQDINTLFTRVEALLRSAIQQRFGDKLPENMRSPNANLLELFSVGGARARALNPSEQHSVLAHLPLRIYITTNFDNMMADALKEAGKAPEVVICPWSERFYADSIYDREPGYIPSKERPLVYHLFGHLSLPDSMVLTEDDYFEFLMGFTANKKRTPPVIPPAVLRAFTDSALLILGFHLDDWAFRALFRTVMVQQGSVRRGRYSHVGVQLEPDDEHNQNPLRARQYLQKYFGQTEINLFWGNAQEFLAELGRQWKPG